MRRLAPAQRAMPLPQQPNRTPPPPTPRHPASTEVCSELTFSKSLTRRRRRPVEVIAVLGAGRVGSTVARGAIAAGYRVLVAGSGAPEQLGLTVEYMIPGAQARWAADAVADADLVILAVPFGQFPSLPLANLGGKPVLDMMTHWPPVDGDVPHITHDASTSEAVAAAFQLRTGVAWPSRLIMTTRHDSSPA
jgi:hypothetical protein